MGIRLKFLINIVVLKIDLYLSLDHILSKIFKLDFMNYLSKICLLATGILLISCGGGESDEEGSEAVDQDIYGGTFTMPIGSYFNTKPLIEIQKLETAQVYDQIFEGLVKYNPKTLEIEPSIASDYSVSDDGLTYTFNVPYGVAE